MPIQRDAQGRFSSGNGHWSDPLVLNTMIGQAINNAQYSLPRGGTQGRGGSPRRDIDAECGFPLQGQIDLEDYAYLFERCSIAARVIELMPRESWKVSPSVYENEDSTIVTAFDEGWRDLGKRLRGESWYKSGGDELGNPIWQMLQLVDELSGIGQFGLLLLGLLGDQDLSKPATGVDETGMKEGNASNELVYLRAYDQTKVQISQYERDKQNPRCGWPTMYDINVAGYSDQGIGHANLHDTTSMRVHWSRVIHIADVFHQSTASDVLAIPRMRPVYNELLGCRKVGGASGEFYWNHGSRDLILETHPRLGGKVRFPSNMREEVEKFQTGLQRSMRLAGMSAKTLNPEVADPTPHLLAQVKLIAIKLGCPERIFWGSERGELASSQDERGWAVRMMGRENNYNTPRIVVPFVDRCIQLGALPQPKQYHAVWPSLLELSPQERATVVKQRTEAMAAYVGGNVYMIMSPIDFLTREMDYTQEEAVEILQTAKDETEGQEPEIPEEPEIPGFSSPISEPVEESEEDEEPTI